MFTLKYQSNKKESEFSISVEFKSSKLWHFQGLFLQNIHVHLLQGTSSLALQLADVSPDVFITQQMCIHCIDCGFKIFFLTYLSGMYVFLIT